MSFDPLQIWRALADATRWRILKELATKPQTTGELAAKFQQTRFGVMKHLGVLCEANLVTFERKGRERWNYLNAAQLRLAIDTLLQPQNRKWSDALLQLKNTVEQCGDTMPEITTIDIRQNLTFNAPAQTVFSALTEHINAWWTEPYRQTASGELKLESHLGGTLAEVSDNGHGSIWGYVEEIKPPERLAISGRFAVKGALSGRIVFSLRNTGSETKLSLSHEAIGMISPEMTENFTQGWHDLLNVRLRAFLDGAIQ
jgi:uncharacterized protein YndB with AHSA1/START domain/DNA-binding transcriptional ArsR family regulator